MTTRARKAAPAKKTAPARKTTPVKKRVPAKKRAPARAARPAKGARPVDRIREICLSLPEVSEKEAWGVPTFRVGGKMFAMFNGEQHEVAVWCKAPLGMQEVLVDADPERFFKPPYVGPSGWIGIRLSGRPDWQEIRGLVTDAWRMTAPRKMLPLVGR